MQKHRQSLSHVTDGVLVYASQALAAFFPLLVSPMIVREKGLDVFGEYVLLLLATQTACIVSEYSFDAIGPRIVAQAIANGETEISAHWAVCVRVLYSKFALFPLGLGIFVFAAWLMVSRPPHLLDAIGCFLMMLGIALQSSWFLITIRQTRLLAGASLIGRAIALVMIIIVLLADLGNASVLLVCTSAAYVIAGAVVLLRNSRFVSSGRRDRATLSLLRQGFFAFGAIAGSALQNLVGTASVGLAIGVSEAGRFAAIDRLARSVSGSLKPLFMVLYPRMADWHLTDIQQAKKVENVCVVLWVGLSCIFMMTAFWFGERLLSTVYGQEMSDSINLLLILVAWLCIGILNNLLGVQRLLAAGRDQVYAAGMWLGLAVTIVCVCLFVPVWHVADSVGMSILVGELAMTVFFLVQADSASAVQRR